MSDPGTPSGPRRPPRPPRPGQPSATPAPPTTTSAPVDPAPGSPSRPRLSRQPRPPRAAPGATSGVRIKKPAAAPATATAPGTAPSAYPAPEGETPTGRLRRVRPQRPPAEDLLPKQEAHLSPFRKRYGVPYDTQGPKVRMGVLWVAAVVASLYPQDLRPWGLAVLYGVVAGFAAAQVIEAHRGTRTSADRAVAAFGASGLSVAATLGAHVLGAGYIALVVAALVAALATPERGRLPIPRAGHTVMAAGICGGAAASLVLLADYEIGALIILLTFVMVYDASDFIVGSGASNGIEGPLSGILFIAAVSIIFAVVNAPPFRGIDIWSFSVLAMVACPAGQMLASAMLPAPNAHAPALRRLDSLLVVAPAWAGLVGLYLARAL